MKENWRVAWKKSQIQYTTKVEPVKYKRATIEKKKKKKSLGGNLFEF